MIFARNAVHVALFLVVAQVALAVTFLLQGAYFIAAIQIIVYAGAIMVLFLFVIMLLGVDRREAFIEPLPLQRILAVGLGALLTAEILYVAWKGVDLIGKAGDDVITRPERGPRERRGGSRSVVVQPLPACLRGDLDTLVVAIVGVMVLTRRITSSGVRSAPVEVATEARKEMMV